MSPGAPTAAYARVLDGRHLWLAVSGATGLRVGGTPVDAHEDGGLLVATIDLTALIPGPPDGGPWPVTDASGRAIAAPPPTPEGPTRDPGPYDVAVESGALVVTHTPAQPGVPVAVIVTDDVGPVIALASSTSEVEVMQQQRVVGTVTAAEGSVRVADVLALELPDAPVWLRLGGAPVVRATSLLARPNASTVLPAYGGRELRWRPDGRLVLAPTGNA